MKANFITRELPKSVDIDGEEYTINCDFRAGIKLDEIVNSDMSEESKLIELLSLYYVKMPTNLQEAIDKILWFYRCGEDEQKEEERQRYKRRNSKEPAYSFSQDSPYIYAAFKEQYGIDLSTIEYLHWWKFVALFNSLNEDTKMSKIMYYRKVSTSGMSRDQRAFINEMKKIYRLNTAGKKLTLKQRDQKLKDYVRSRSRGVM